DYVMAHRLWPLAVDRTRVVCEWYFHPQEMAKPDFRADDAVEFWDATNREDWEISEWSQKGVSSRAYEPGPYSTREGLPMGFDLKFADPTKPICLKPFPNETVYIASEWRGRADKCLILPEKYHEYCEGEPRYCAGQRGYGSVGEIRAARKERCTVVARLRQRP